MTNAALLARVRELIFGDPDPGSFTRIRVHRLALIAPFLSERSAVRALDLVLEAPELAEATWTLTELLPKLAEADRRACVHQMLERITLDSSDFDKAEALRLLAPHTSAAYAYELLRAAKSISVPRLAAEAFIHIVPHLPQRDLPELLSSVSQLSDDESLTAALVGVAPSVGDDLLDKLRSASMRIAKPQLRKLAVLALDEQWPWLPQQRAEHLRRLLAQVGDPLRSVISLPLRSLLEPPTETGTRPEVAELQQLFLPLSPYEREQILEDVLWTFARHMRNAPPARPQSAAPHAYELPEPLEDERLSEEMAAPDSGPGPATGRKAAPPPGLAPSPGAAPPLGAPSFPGAFPAPGAIPPPAAAAMPAPIPASQAGAPKPRLAPVATEKPLDDVLLGHLDEDLDVPSQTKEQRPPRSPARVRQGGNVVNTGFSSPYAPAAGLSRHSALVCGASYYFWLDVGTWDKRSIERTPRPLPALPVDAEVDVILFDFARDERGERPHLALSGKTRGVLRIAGDGSGQVVKPAAIPDSHALPVNDPLRGRRLFFQVDAPAVPGDYALRVGIYYQNNLLQSRLVRAVVAVGPREAPNALSSELDYVITHALSPALLRKLPQQRLSVMLNDDGEGLVGFRFVGEQNFQRDTTLSAAKLKTQIDMARQALHMASWGSPDAYARDRGLPDRYADGTLNLERLTQDLVGLAAAGYRLWIELGRDLAGGTPERKKLADLMRKSGSVQLALKRSASFVFPVALLYDQRIDAQTADTLCPAFKKALESATPLETAACFQGECPSINKLNVVCPSGFWGFRHELGIPLSVADGDQLVTEIPAANAIDFDALAHRDLALRASHLDALRTLRPTMRWSYAEGRDPAIELLQNTEPHIVYFYCHGGYRERDKLPYLDLGGPVALTPDYLTAAEVYWNDRRPLVFLNGCHTTALTPEIAIHLVNAFLVEARAAGVLGTEITVFETLAAPFAEHCLREFVSGTPIGAAVRRARLAILATGNPLGLAYIPFVTNALRLTETSP